MSMGMPNIDDRDLRRRVDNGKWSIGTDGIKNGAIDHEKEGGDKRDRQEGNLRSGQHRDEVRQKSVSGHYFRFFHVLSNSICSMEFTV